MATPWTWRSFGTYFGPAEKVIRQHASDTRSCHETHLVSERPDVSVTLCDDVFDVTKLTSVAANGVEQWTPFLNASFPLATSVVDQLFALWRLPVPERMTAPISQRKFIQLLEPLAEIRMVPVTRLQHRGSWCGSIVEIAELIVDGRLLRTLAIEGAGPGPVMNTVMRLGLDVFENVNYVKQLQWPMTATPRTAPSHPAV